MQVNIITFGQLSDIIGERFVIHDAANTDALKAQLEHQFPMLATMKYIIAVDKKQVSINTPLTDGCTIALMPAFSGG
jgi:molybdopterin converting factor small subunit